MGINPWIKKWAIVLRRKQLPKRKQQLIRWLQIRLPQIRLLLRRKQLPTSWQLIRPPQTRLLLKRKQQLIRWLQIRLLPTRLLLIRLLLRREQQLIGLLLRRRQRLPLLLLLLLPSLLLHLLLNLQNLLSSTKPLYQRGWNQMLLTSHNSKNSRRNRSWGNFKAFLNPFTAKVKYCNPWTFL